MQLAVGQPGDFAAVSLKDDRSFFGVAIFQVAVQAVVGNIQLAISEPFVERGTGFIQGLGEWLVPGEILARQAPPEAIEVALGFIA
jgi:hypothetical protein